MLKLSKDRYDFISRLKSLGYVFGRTEDQYAHPTVIAPGWKRPIRLDGLGYTAEVINARFEEHRKNEYFYTIQNQHRPYKPKAFPLESIIKELTFEAEHSYDTATVLIDTMFLVVIMVAELIAELADVMLLSPELRFAVKDVQNYIYDHEFLRNNDIHTIPQLEQNIKDTKSEIASLESERKKTSNRIRRAKTPEDMAELKTHRKDITKKITPLRKQLRRAEQILEKSPHLYELLREERRLEKQKIKGREDRYR